MDDHTEDIRMKTAVVGFPRVGKNRELKFATEKYFKGEISEQELLNEAAQIRKYNPDLSP